ncbi:MAG: aspartate/glutamate racemase family protein [Collinsella sp.]
MSRCALCSGWCGDECEFDPNLSMPAEPVHKIGIMGTDGTVGAGVYGRECKAAGVEEVVYPSATRQNDVMSLIYDDVKAGREPDMDKFDRVMWEFARSGCDRVILACTELSVLQKYREMPEITRDAMEVLVRDSIIRSGAPYRL